MGCCTSDDSSSGKVYDTESVKEEMNGEYITLMQASFYCFAGYQPWAKIKHLYMKKKELQIFLDIVNIDDSVDDVLKLMDIDIEDGKLTVNEWMDYFTNESANSVVFQLKHHIEEQVTWQLLVKALQVFDAVDDDHSNKIEYGEFERFGEAIGLNGEETEVLWNKIDADKSGAIDIVELFTWFKSRLYDQCDASNKQ
eukprot:385145_1